MTDTAAAIYASLRAWARGMYTTEAATELLVRSFGGKFASPDQPWIHPTDNGYWIDFAGIPGHIGALSGGEQRLLRIVASIGSSDTSVNLSDDISGLDRPTLRLVLAAIAHAGGSHQQSSVVVEPSGGITISREPSLHPWE